MLPREIVSRVGDTISVDIDECHWFQGKLKSIEKKEFEKLKKSILKEGVIDTINVWEDDNKKLQILDGHQTKFVLTALRKEGYSLPPVKATKILAENYKKAKEYVLLMTSAYGKATQESVSDYFIDSELSFDDLKDLIDIPGIDLSFKDLDDSLKDNNGINVNMTDEKQFIIAIECSNEEEMQNIFEELKGRGLQCKLIM